MLSYPAHRHHHCEPHYFEEEERKAGRQVACLPCLLSSHATFIQKTPSVVIHIKIHSSLGGYYYRAMADNRGSEDLQFYTYISLYMPECICISLMSWEVTQMFREILKLMAVVIVRQIDIESRGWNQDIAVSNERKLQDLTGAIAKQQQQKD